MENQTGKKLNSFLSFKLGEETFAANVGKVLNVLEMTKITKVPKAPEYMKGVINLRGTVLPLIDTRIKFGLEPTEFTTNTCILVLDVNLEGESVHVGALVDSVQEVLEINEAEVGAPPSIGNKYRSEFIEGVARVNDEFIMLLDMDLIFSLDELRNLKETAESEKKETVEG
ncbi:MAG: chemotaxis protein CheW [Bacteroidota bacterium]